jgi:hypothetical protein
VTDDVELRVIQLAYQRALGMPVLMNLELLNDLAHELSAQTAETSDIDQRNEFASSSEFRDTFARQYALWQFDRTVAGHSAQEVVDAYSERVRTTRFFDHLALQSVIGTNAEEIVLGREYAEDASLGSLDPAIYPARGRSAAAVPEYAFTPLAQSARMEVKDVQSDLREIKGGWFGTGSRRDIPAGACYVGRYRDRYAWVCPDGVPALSDFTIAILEFSGLIEPRTVFTVPGGPRFAPSSNH